MRSASFFLLLSGLALAFTGCLPEKNDDAESSASEPTAPPAAPQNTENTPETPATPPAVPQADTAIQAKVRSIIAETLGVDGTSFQLSDSLISGLNANELDVVDIIMLVEEAFQISIPENAYLDAENDTSKTFSANDLVRIVERKTQQQQQ